MRGHPWLTLITLSIGAMMVSLDGTVITVAQPAMQSGLRAGLTEIQWVTNGYLLAVAVLLITAGKLGDRFGHRKMFLAGVVGFTASSVAIGLSANITWVIGLRVLQGVFGALMQPATLGLMRTAFPADKLTMPIAIRSAVIAASTAAGPIVGGLLVEHAGWQWVFFANVPLGALALGLGLLVLRDVRTKGAARPFDIAGVHLLTAALASLVWGLTQAPAHGWTDPRTLGFLAAALGLGCCFVRRESRADEPLVPLRMFHSSQFSAGVVLMIVMSFIMFGAPFILVFYLQNVLHLSPMESGIRVLGLTGMMILGAPLVAIWMSRVGPRLPALLGMAVTAAAMTALSQLGPRPATVHLVLCFFLLGLGFSPVMVSATKIVLSNAPMELSGVAGGIQQTAMQVGGSLGTAALGAIVGARVDSLLPGRLAEAGVALPSARADAASQAVSVGLVPRGVGESADASALARISELTFLDGMEYALLAATAVAVLGALTALLVRGRGPAEPDDETPPARTAETHAR
ncbi:tetracenomycin C resistance and export protein [Streptomyces sp. CB02923]|nr:tetracenomycin C resistance and export protein [Streptomyces sp. CB02923]